MKPKKITLFGLFIIASLVAMVVNAQELTPTPISPPTSELNQDSPASSFVHRFWIALLATLIAGAVGGVVYELLILQGNIELPHKPTKEEVIERYPYAIVEHMYDLGIFARVIIGALAAVAARLILSPSTDFALLATAIVAGAAGISVFSSMKDRILAALAQKDAADIRARADRQSAKLEEVTEAFVALKGKLIEESKSPRGSRKLTFEAEKDILDLEDLDKIERLLNEAKGIYFV